MKTYEIRELYKDKMDAGSWKTIEAGLTKEEAQRSLDSLIEYSIIENKEEGETNADYFKIKDEDITTVD